MWVMWCKDLKDNLFFSHSVQHLRSSEDLLIYLLIKTKKGSEVIDVSYSYIISRLEVFKETRIPRGKKKWQPTPVFPGKSHGQRSLEGYSP